MIEPITAARQKTLRNPVLAAYAERYIRIADNYYEQVGRTGIKFADAAHQPPIEGRREHLVAQGACYRNGGKSVVVNQISPACVACQTGIGSATFFISLRCHRTCFYCFNPNQEDYDHHREHLRNPAQELEQMHAAGQKVHTLALTGGEPLLYKERAYAFFRTAARLYPEAHTRLYTCGDHADEATLRELRDAGLDEIRFSIRMHDTEKSQHHTFERIALAKQFIPQVMVEMPVLPSTFDRMTAILLELERLQIHSINLLELCYPYGNAHAFNDRGFVVKNPPHRVLYNYWYAGGVPVQGSEEVCLDLIEFALEQGLTIGVHYCSLENKHTGQIYQQNLGQKLPGTAVLSQNDYLLKSAKAFGGDMPPVLDTFRRKGIKDYTVNDNYQFVEFPVSQIETLRDLDIDVAISSSVVEVRGGERFIRELSVDVTTPQAFDLSTDI